MPLQVAISVHDDAPEEEARIVDLGLSASNSQAAPMHEVRALSCFARIPQGAVVGGAIGRTWGLCCELQQLWVHADHRRQGIGTRLVQEFEMVAQSRGCNMFYLDTFSFMAPSLYRSLGYEAKLTLHGFSPGVTKYTMIKHGATRGA